MKLYYFPVAPNPTKVLVYLREKGIEIELQQVSLGEGEQNESEHLARNPRGALPVLELDDGSFVTESLPIIEYLEECYPEPVMIGETPEQRVRTREMERLADLRVLLPIGRTVHATNSPLGKPPNPAVAENEPSLIATCTPRSGSRLTPPSRCVARPRRRAPTSSRPSPTD